MGRGLSRVQCNDDALAGRQRSVQGLGLVLSLGQGMDGLEPVVKIRPSLDPRLKPQPSPYLDLPSPCSGPWQGLGRGLNREVKAGPGPEPSPELGSGQGRDRGLSPGQGRDCAGA